MLKRGLKILVDEFSIMSDVEFFKLSSIVRVLPHLSSDRICDGYTFLPLLRALQYNKSGGETFGHSDKAVRLAFLN